MGGVASPEGEYLKSFLDAQGTCTVHTSAPEPVEPEGYDPNSFDISDPSTWPPANDPQYGSFDPENPATWPTPVPEETPGTGETVPPEATPTPTPAETPPDEPFVPVTQPS